MLLPGPSWGFCEKLCMMQVLSGRLSVFSFLTIFLSLLDSILPLILYPGPGSSSLVSVIYSGISFSPLAPTLTSMQRCEWLSNSVSRLNPSRVSKSAGPKPTPDHREPTTHQMLLLTTTIVSFLEFGYRNHHDELLCFSITNHLLKALLFYITHNAWIKAFLIILYP